MKLFIIYLLSWIHVVFATNSLCLDTLTLKPAPKITPTKVKKTLDQDTNPAEDSPTTTNRIVTIEDETYIEISKNNNKGWFSTSSVNPYALQGNPVLLAKYLSFTLSQVLGLRYNEEQQKFYAPTPETMNARLKVFNTWLQTYHPKVKPLRVNFAWQNSSSLYNYIKNIAQNFTLPVNAAMGTHTVHDVSYHYSAITLSKPFLDRIQTRSLLIQLFLEEIEKEFKHDPTIRKEVMAWIKTGLNREVAKIDSMLSYGNEDFQKNNTSSFDEDYEYHINNTYYTSLLGIMVDSIAFEIVHPDLNSIPTLSTPIIDDFKNTLLIDLEIARRNSDTLLQSAMRTLGLKVKKKNLSESETRVEQLNHKHPFELPYAIVEDAIYRIKTKHPQFNKPIFNVPNDFVLLLEQQEQRHLELSIYSRSYLKWLENKK